MLSGETGKFGKTIFFFFLENNDEDSYHVEITGRPVNLGLSKGMLVPWKLLFTGRRSFTELLNEKLKIE